MLEEHIAHHCTAPPLSHPSTRPTPHRQTSFETVRRSVNSYVLFVPRVYLYLSNMSFSPHPLPSPLSFPVSSSPLDGACSATSFDTACSATSEAASKSCPQVGDVLLRPPIKKESLADRSDAIICASAFALAACALMAKWPLAQTFTHADATLLFDYTWSLPTGAIVVYLAMVHVLGPYLRRSNSKEPAFGLTERSIKEALKYWNLFLALLSICMLFGMGIPLLQFSVQYGLEEAICDGKHRRWGGPAFVWMYVFTLSKYIELFDTAFMIVRRKPVSFLHWYHHTSVLAYTWFAVVVGFCPGWYFATINSGVHTIMYFYYYRSACGVRLTYDRLITTCQLTQMVLGVCITGWWAVMHYLPQDGAERCPCEQAGSAMASALFMYGSYFLLFLSFYLQRYQAGRKAAQKRAMEKVE